MIHQNRCQSWKSLSVYLLTSQWVSQSATKQMGAQWLKFSGFFAALVTHIPFCALCWQVEPWTAGKLKLFHYFICFFCLHFFFYTAAQERKINDFSFYRPKETNSWCIFYVQWPHQPGPFAQDVTGLVQFVRLLQAEHRTETNAQTGRQVKDNPEQLLGSRARSCWTLISFFLTPL